MHAMKLMSESTTDSSGAISKQRKVVEELTKANAIDVGRYSRKATDSAGNNKAIDDDVIIMKLGVS